jgi:DNA-binding PadR family transcriptional regulator
MNEKPAVSIVPEGASRMRNLTFQILAVLQAGPADGQAILHRLRELGDPGPDPSLPTLYRSLRAALQQRWIETTASDAGTGPGRPPQSYRLTGAGLQAVEVEARRHRELAALVLGPDSTLGHPVLGQAEAGEPEGR